MPKLNLALIVPFVFFIGLAGAFFIGLSRENPDDLPTVFIDKPAQALPVEQLADLIPRARLSE